MIQKCDCSKQYAFDSHYQTKCGQPVKWRETEFDSVETRKIINRKDFSYHSIMDQEKVRTDWPFKLQSVWYVTMTSKNNIRK